MRMTRILTAILAFALLGLAPLGLVSTASAQGASTPVSSKEARSITIQGIEPKDGVFFIKGKISPDYKKRGFTVERKIDKGSWSKYTKAKTKANGTYRVKVAAKKSTGKACYRVKIAGSGGYQGSKSQALCITTYRL